MVALFCAAILSQAADFNQRPLHFGFSAAGSYIGIWHLDDEVLVKKETDTNDDGSHFYREQSLTGGHDLKGVGGSVGVSGLWDFARNFQLHTDLYISLRYRFVDATEHHKKIMWYVLGEKNIIGIHNYNSVPKLPMWLIVSGTYTLDESGRVVGSLRCCHEK